MQPPLKILCVEPYTFSPGHPRWFATELCEGLGRRGHEVTLVTFGNVLEEGVEGSRPFSVLDVAKENTLTRFLGWGSPVRSNLRSAAGFCRLYWDLRTFPPAFRMATQQAYDIVHCLDWHPVTLWWAARLFSGWRCGGRTAMAGTLHHLGRLARGKDSFLGVSIRYYRRALASLVQEYMQAVFVLDETLRAEVIERLHLPRQHHEKIVLVPHGMDTGEPPYGRSEARRRLGIDGEERILLLAGVLRRDKGIDVAIRAMQEAGSCRLYIVGAPFDCDVEELRALIRACNCENSVILDPRYLAEDEMQDYILVCDALLLPYRKTFRGQSGVVAHASRYARCVIASDVGAVGNIIRQFGFGFTVEPESPEKLRDAIRKFLDLTASERLEMESKAKLAAQSYSWDEMCRRIEEVYYRCTRAPGCVKVLQA